MQPQNPADYATPQLIVYGTVADLTRGGIAVSTADLQSTLDGARQPKK
jgi:hypothetical protein